MIFDCNEQIYSMVQYQHAPKKISQQNYNNINFFGIQV